MNLDSTYNQNYDLFVSLLAEMVVSYYGISSNGNEKEGNEDEKQKSKEKEVI